MLPRSCWIHLLMITSGSMYVRFIQEMMIPFRTQCYKTYFECCTHTKRFQTHAEIYEVLIWETICKVGIKKAATALNRPLRFSETFKIII